MEDAVLSVLIIIGLFQLLFWILLEIDVYFVASSDATVSGIPLTWIPYISIMLPILGITVQLWYFFSREEFLAGDE